MFEHYLNIFITTVFIENIALSVFLGMCTFLAISKKIDAAIGSWYCCYCCLSYNSPSQ
jgi:Na+-transporting NADH:ubiquinone oxidoreductase subunit E